jgi:hypothetical protein
MRFSKHPKTITGFIEPMPPGIDPAGWAFLLERLVLGCGSPCEQIAGMSFGEGIPGGVTA